VRQNGIILLEVLNNGIKILAQYVVAHQGEFHNFSN
jgi:hypothetical protein